MSENEKNKNSRAWALTHEIDELLEASNASTEEKVRALSAMIGFLETSGGY